MNETILSGPLFDGRADAETIKFTEEIEKKVAEEAVSRIKAYLPQQYKYLGHNGGNPKDNPVPQDPGYYESQIHAESTSEGTIVTDTPAIYGPWLEGVSNRNQAERFPGYAAFRTVSQAIDRDALGMAEKDIQPYIAAMNI